MNINLDPNRIFITGDQGEILAEITYPADGEGVVNINRTFVSPVLRGQGVAGKLMEAAVQQIRDAGQKCRVTCSYAAEWMQRHPEWRELLV